MNKRPKKENQTQTPSVEVENMDMEVGNQTAGVGAAMKINIVMEESQKKYQ
jgi:hypothetical protein